MTVSTSSPPPEPRRGGVLRLPAPALRLAGRLFTTAYWSLSDYGWVWIGVTTPTAPLDHGTTLQGPPPGHPERLTALPPTPVESALERQLTDDWDPVPGNSANQEMTRP
ncbi:MULTISPECIES: DUF6059 family protein [unclassified Streptomyces]|uniref:DUF6059 family protein n=1 Tax=unclassified Streptomyces TaxID=2593676 RepID=UPI0036F73C5F